MYPAKDATQPKKQGYDEKGPAPGPLIDPDARSNGKAQRGGVTRQRRIGRFVKQ
jgi:hypothetical protein